MVRIHAGEPPLSVLILLGVWPSEIAKPFVLRFESYLVPPSAFICVDSVTLPDTLNLS